MALFASATASATINPTAASKNQEQSQSNNLYTSQRTKDPIFHQPLPTKQNKFTKQIPIRNHFPSQRTSQPRTSKSKKTKKHQIRTRQHEEQRIKGAHKQSQSKPIHSKRETVERIRRRRGRRRPVKLESLMLAWARSAKRAGSEGWRSMAWE